MSTQSIPKTMDAILKALHIHNPVLLGKGGEGYVFAYTRDTVVKIYNNANNDYLESLVKLQTFISSKNLPIETPQIQEIGNVDNTYYTIEKKLTGITMEKKFPTLSSTEKYIVLKNYYEAIKTLNTIECPDLAYGSIVQTSLYPLTDTTWPGFLIKMVRQRIGLAGERLIKDVGDLTRKVEQFEAIITKELSINEKRLVHADYFINQVLVDDNNEISAILDISFHAVVGDKRLDVGSVAFFDGYKEYLPEHIDYLIDLAIEDYGESILKYNAIYKLYYSFYFSDIYNQSPEIYQAFVNNLNNDDLWKIVS